MPLLTVFLFASVARAENDDLGEPPALDSPWHLDLVFLTEFPLHVGGELAAEVPGRVRGGVALGYLPPGYVAVFNAIAEAAGGEDAGTAQAIADSLEHSLVLRVHVGWRPFPRYGFYFDVGYGLTVLGGGTPTDAVTHLLEEVDLSETAGLGLWELSARLHMVTVEVGYCLISRWGWTLRFAIGGAFTVGAVATAKPQFTSLDPLVAAAIEHAGGEATRRITDVLSRYTHSPTVTVAFGYRFF